MTGSILSYHQTDSIKLQCEIDLKKLLPSPKQRERFNKKWNDFLESDLCNIDIFKREGDYLIYQSEQLIPTKPDNRPPFLLVLGNPASHSVKEGMFFSFEGNKKEHRFWKDILRKAGVLKLNQSDSGKTIEELNESRKKQLLNIKYKSPFRIGLCVYISMPSTSDGKSPWSGVAGVQKLIGSKAMEKLEKEETLRVIECAKKFLSPNGIAVAFQKNAWNGLKSDKDKHIDINNYNNSL